MHTTKRKTRVTLKMSQQTLPNRTMQAKTCLTLPSRDKTLTTSNVTLHMDIYVKKIKFIEIINNKYNYIS